MNKIADLLTAAVTFIFFFFFIFKIFSVVVHSNVWYNYLKRKILSVLCFVCLEYTEKYVGKSLHHPSALLSTAEPGSAEQVVRKVNRG